ncbi:MAG TPA: ClbS/DfsB family four-helix bundle protein [Anaerolineales bacterium]|nr:ClbS/DfsB family four-helix bundle protein [Anaerolineales bacterium]
MDEPITKESILLAIRTELAALNATLARIDRTLMTVPGVEGDWSVKDILSHLASWRRLLVVWTNDLIDGRTPNRPDPTESWGDIDQVNNSLYLETRDRSLDEALDEFASACEASTALVEGLTEADLTDPARFTWRRGVPLWQMVAGNTWVHDREHRESIEQWLSEREA